VSNSESIVILSGNHLCHNPRVIKEASTLAQAGYAVEVLGAWFDSDLKRRDQDLIGRVPFTFSPVADFTTNNAKQFIGRIKSKAAKFAHQSLGFESGWQLGPVIAALLKAAHKSEADLFLAHSEAAMMVAASMLKKGRKVGVDMEDWFSEDLLPEMRRGRPVKLLRDLESRLLNEGVHTTCTSRAMGDALAREYGCDQPMVIYNAFAWEDRIRIDGLVKDRRDRKIPSIHWYSQTLGFGRGVEELIAALTLMKEEAEIHLRGKPVVGFPDWLAAQLPPTWRDRVIVHDLVSNDELLSRIAEHDIGFAGEQTHCRSRDLTVTNKILHYLIGGLAVVASDTAGQHEVARQAGRAIHLYRRGDAVDLARRLDFLLSSRTDLARAKEDALVAAEKIFCWEEQAPRLTERVVRALC
jgi:glycosyltransferase involved in cell wall biosynthesis